MTYHIKTIVNNSDRSVALTNPLTGTSKRDCVLILPGKTYTPEHPPLVNKIGGNPTYLAATAIALNIYTKRDNYCFWDNENSAMDWIGENDINARTYSAQGGDMKLTVNSDATISFTRL